MRSPSDQAEIAAQIILLVRSGRATSRRMLSEVAHLSPTTAGMYVDQLITSGLLSESGLEQGAMGRPKRLLTVQASAGWFAGVELNAERAQAMAVDFSGQVKASKVVFLPRDPEVETVLPILMDMVRAMKKTMTGAGPLLGIGIGAPGVVEPTRGVGVFYSFIRGWNEVALDTHFRKAFHVPVTVENNLRVTALAERWHGDGRDLQDYVILGPRSGFGVAMVQGGKLVTGARFAAGEIGRWPWPLHAETSRQEVQVALSAPAIYRRLSRSKLSSAVPNDLHSAFTKLAGTTGPEWDEVVRDYGRLIGILHLLLDAEAYLLHGPLTALGKRFCEAVVQAAMSLCPAISKRSVRLEPSRLGDNAGALGAASLAMEAWSPAEI